MRANASDPATDTFGGERSGRVTKACVPTGVFGGSAGRAIDRCERTIGEAEGWVPEASAVQPPRSVAVTATFKKLRRHSLLVGGSPPGSRSTAGDDRESGSELAEDS